MKYWLNSLKLRKQYCFNSNDPFIMLVLINRTMNTLCVIIKMGKLMTQQQTSIPSWKKYYFYSPGQSNHGGETICNIGMTRSRKFDKSLVSHKLWLTCNKKYNNFSHHLIKDCMAFSSQLAIPIEGAFDLYTLYFVSECSLILLSPEDASQGTGFNYSL